MLFFSTYVSVAQLRLRRSEYVAYVVRVVRGVRVVRAVSGVRVEDMITRLNRQINVKAKKQGKK